MTWAVVRKERLDRDRVARRERLIMMNGVRGVMFELRFAVLMLELLGNLKVENEAYHDRTYSHLLWEGFVSSIEVRGVLCTPSCGFLPISSRAQPP